MAGRARIRGMCDVCGRRVSAGDGIVSAVPGKRTVRHRSCAPGRDAGRRAELVGASRRVLLTRRQRTPGLFVALLAVVVGLAGIGAAVASGREWSSHSPSSDLAVSRPRPTVTSTSTTSTTSTTSVSTTTAALTTTTLMPAAAPTTAPPAITVPRVNAVAVGTVDTTPPPTTAPPTAQSTTTIAPPRTTTTTTTTIIRCIPGSLDEIRHGCQSDGGGGSKGKEPSG
ncbi:MAG TPA: hypothetical protein VGQ20_05340 [Acidimicrobiales bacterium]|nr:hypothetical protein [Acidimicrobiales bacterium]